MNSLNVTILFYFRGSFEILRRGIPEVFNGIQAYLSTCASFKVREVGIQLPHKIQLVEVPRHSSWPLQFKEVNPTEDNIALFFFAKDAERYCFPHVSLVSSALYILAHLSGLEQLRRTLRKTLGRHASW
jgi:hypothetical protein